jgi:hypothetical protein
VFDLLTTVAREEGIPHQISVFGATTPADANATQVSRSGVPTGVVGVPPREGNWLSYCAAASEGLPLGAGTAATADLFRWFLPVDDPDLTQNWRLRITCQGANTPEATAKVSRVKLG